MKTAPQSHSLTMKHLSVFLSAAALAGACAFAPKTGAEEPAMPAPAAPAVTYIARPAFPGEFHLYPNPDPADVAAEQWYEIAGRGQFVRNVKAPTLIPYLTEKGAGNGAAIIIAPGGAFLHHTFGSGGYEAAEWFRSRGFAELHLYGLGGHNFGMGPPTFSHERQKAFSDMRAAKRL